MRVDRLMTERSTPAGPLLLVEEISHRVINEYAEAISSLSLAARSVEPGSRAVIASAAARLKAHADAHRALMPPLACGPINLSDYLIELCASFSRAYLEEHRVRVTLTTDEVWLPADTAWRIGLILAELVRNAWRHGLAGGSGAIAIRLTARPGAVCCTVADSGHGDAGNQPGRGARVVRSIAAEIGGSVEWRFSENGSLALLEVPRRG